MGQGKPGHEPAANQVTDADVQSRIPLKALDFSVLLILAQEENYGYEIVKRIGEAEGGGISISPTNLYQVLDRMISAGLVSPLGRRQHGDRPARKYFGITPLGLGVVQAEGERLRRVMQSLGKLDLALGEEG